MKTTPDEARVRLPKLGYSRTEAAEILGISPFSVDRLRKRGLLRPSRGLRRPIYTLKELERYLRDTSETGEDN